MSDTYLVCARCKEPLGQKINLLDPGKEPSWFMTCRHKIRSVADVLVIDADGNEVEAVDGAKS